MELLDYLRTLVKGNPNAVELLFADNNKDDDDALHCTSWIWEELRARRRTFLTSQCAGQYVGYIGSHLARAKKLVNKNNNKNSKIVDNPQAFSKAMYHVFHKLLELRRILDGQDLHVALRGKEREFVYAIRTTQDELQGDLAPKVLLKKADSMLARLREQKRKKDFVGGGGPELSHEDVEQWCLSVRTRLLYGGGGGGKQQ
eukprot:CAMPEP_0116560770 /NCGR_PEP_ID=MMETSP0397-20121206/11187_1 /TAXON_ID=216820 /ORGANISM="Cyclophora tenuis, Strain ECT3854" /LENGTH=200 /DNA_ID=CAMNT_0004086789 /DNA_START=234 /DNA_END=833 /DNA_ORIENTATION=-